MYTNLYFRSFAAFVPVFALVAFLIVQVNARPGVNVTTYHNDQSRTGQNLNETILTPANVKTGLFGRLYDAPLDGYVYAQPLYVSQVNVPGKGKRNIVFVATEHDSVYAFDADATQAQDPLWRTNFLDPANNVTTVPSPDTNSGDLVPEIGITSTPVIDLATNTIFVEAKTKEGTAANPTWVHKLHALDIATGQERPGSPITIDATWPSSSGDSQNGMIRFNAHRAHQRAGLALVNGVVYIAFASHGDNQPYHGWVLGYDEKSLRQVSVFNATPEGLGGIWQGGASPGVDEQGNLYVITGNADFNLKTGTYGDSLIKLTTQNGGLAVADYFAPFNQQHLNDVDGDFGSGGILLLPDTAGSTAHPHLMLTAGKEGRIYLIDRDNLGRFDPVSDHVTQSLQGFGGLFSCPAYFNGSVYYAGGGQPLKAMRIANGQLSAPYAETPVSFGGRVATPAISAEGNNNGIVWIVQIGAPGTLYAFDAKDVSHLLYQSESTAISQGIKFNTPTIANGHVFVGTANSLAVFGLLDKATSAPSEPYNVSATSVTDSSTTFTWQHDATSVASYRIERSTDGRNFALDATVPRDQLTYTDDLLNPDTKYNYRVLATNSISDSRPSKHLDIHTDRLPVPKGIVAYLPLDDGDGIVARDPINNGLSGNLLGELTWNTGPHLSSVALTFHGTGNAVSRVVVPASPQLQYSAAQSFTWSVWVNPVEASTRTQAVVSDARATDAWAQLGATPDGKWTFAGPGGDITGGTAVPGWHLLVAVQDGKANQRRLYDNGILIGSGVAQAANGNGELWIGGATTGNASFKGTLSEVTIYNRALNDKEISTLTAAK